MADLSKLSTADLERLLMQMMEATKGERQAADYQRNLGEERQKMMDERGFLENAAAGLGKAGFDAVRGIAQWFPGGPSREEIDRQKQVDAPLMESGGGLTGNLAGQVGLSLAPLGVARVASMAPRAAQVIDKLPGANTVLGGGALGLGLGAAQPVGTDDSRFANMVLSGGAGAALPLGVLGWRAGKAALDPLLGQAGMDRASGRVLSRFATNPDESLARMQAAKSGVPGVKPTVGEATLDEGLNTLERSMNNFPGQMQGGIDRRLAENNAARQQFLEGLAGTAEDTAKAKAARSVAFDKGINAIGALEADVPVSRTVGLIDRLLASPNAESAQMRQTLSALRDRFFESYPAKERLTDASRIIRDAVNEARKRGLNAADTAALEEAQRVLGGTVRKLGAVEDGAHKGLAMDALTQVEQITSRTKGAQKAIQEVVDLVGSDGTAFKTDPARLSALYREMNQIRAGLKRDGADMPTLKALDAVRRSLGNSIDRSTNYAGPSFKAVNREYAEASKKIDAQTILQDLKTRASGRPTVEVSAAGDPLLGQDVLYLNKFVQATDPRRQAATVAAAKVGKRNPGAFDKYLDENQLGGVNTLREDSARALEAANRGKAKGSPTAQFLYAQQLLGEALGPLGLPTSMADRIVGSVTSAPFVGPVLGAANNIAGRRMALHMGEVLQDPARAAALMQATRAQDLRMLNPGVSRLLPPGLAAMVSGGMFSPRQLPQEDSPYPPRW